MTLYRIVVFVVLLLLGSINVSAQIVVIEGSAKVLDGVSQARGSAIEDALHQAALYGGAKVQSTTLVEDNIVTSDFTRLHTSGDVKMLALLNEWRNGDRLHVKIKAKIGNVGAVGNLENYRKKVAVVQFEIMERSDIQDLVAFERLFPQQILRLLESSRSVSPVDATRYLFSAYDKHQHDVSDPPSRAAVIRLAAELGVQFVVQGIVHDLGLVANGMGYRRNAVMEIMVLDGLTGLVIGRHTYSEDVVGGQDLRVKNNFNDPVFKNQPLGKILYRILGRQAEAIQSDLQGLPFSARVVRSEGSLVIFDAGTINRVKVGDVFHAYQVEPGQNINTTGQYLGVPESWVARLVVKKVQPMFAQGELAAENAAALRPGDIVRTSR